MTLVTYIMSIAYPLRIASSKTLMHLKFRPDRLENALKNIRGATDSNYRFLLCSRTKKYL